MKASLTIAERIALFNILPEQGTILTLRTINDIKALVAFTDKELKDYKIKQKETPNGIMMVWDSDFSNIKVEFDISDSAKSLIYSQLAKMSDEGRLRMEMLTLYEKFVEKPN